MKSIWNTGADQYFRMLVHHAYNKGTRCTEKLGFMLSYYVLTSVKLIPICYNLIIMPCITSSFSTIVSYFAILELPQLVKIVDG